MGNEAYAQIGKRVKTYRSERGLSQEELAEGICSSSTISLLETGQHVPSAEIMQSLADRLSIPLQEILQSQEHRLEVKLQVDLVKVYVESRNFEQALHLMNDLEHRQVLRDFQTRELILYKAESLMQMGKANEALPLLTDLQQKLEQRRETDDRFMVMLYDKLGKTNYLLANVADAHAHYLRAYQLSLRFPVFDHVSAKISYNLGMVLRVMNRHQEAIPYLEKAKHFFAENSDLKRLAQTYLELGIVYQNDRQFETSSRYLNEAMVIYRTINHVSMATHVRRTYATVILSNTDPEKAIEELKGCAADFEATGNKIRSIQAYSHLAFVMLTVKMIDEAGNYLQKALTRFSEQDAEQDPRLVYVYQVYAMYLLESKNFTACETFSRKAACLFEAMGYEKNAADSLHLTAKAYRSQGEWEKANSLLEQVNQKLRHLQHDKISSDLEVI